jgi:TRAP-type C4-dicarboxylate transport system substrate-binding protein
MRRWRKEPHEGRGNAKEEGMRISAISALGALAVAFPASMPAAQTVDGPVVEWRHSNWGKRRANTEGIERVAAILKERTGGKFTIKIGYGEVFSKDKENLDSIKLGAIEMADMCNFYHPGKTPAWMVFSLPFLPLDDLRVMAVAADAEMRHPALMADLAQWNAMPYFYTILPQYEFMGKGKPPKTLDDWKGVRVRAPGAVGDAFKLLGAHLSTVPAVELYTALERGTVDAASFPFTYAHAAYQLHTISNWFTSNLSPGVAGCAAVVNKDAYAKLPPQYQKLLQEAQPEAYKAMIEAYEAADKVNLPMFREKLTEIRYSDADLKRFQEIAGKPIWDKWVADNQAKFDAKGVLDNLLKEIEAAKAKVGKI